MRRLPHLNGIRAFEVAARHGIPVFLYEASATLPYRRNLAEIRRGGPNAASPIIAFSASADPREMEPLRLQGFDGCLPKPFTLADLIRAVEAAMAAPADLEASVCQLG